MIILLEKASIYIASIYLDIINTQKFNQRLLPGYYK